jgi:hypothetical protein
VTHGTISGVLTGDFCFKWGEAEEKVLEENND